MILRLSQAFLPPHHRPFTLNLQKDTSAPTHQKLHRVVCTKLQMDLKERLALCFRLMQESQNLKINVYILTK